MLAKRLALTLLAAGSPLLLVALCLGGVWAEWVVLALVTLLPVAITVAAVAEGRGSVALAVFLALVIALLTGGLALAVVLPAEPWIGGFPAPTAVLVYGVGLATLVVVVLAYALTFDRLGIDREDLERLAALGGRREAHDEEPRRE